MNFDKCVQMLGKCRKFHYHWKVPSSFYPNMILLQQMAMAILTFITTFQFCCFLLKNVEFFLAGKLPEYYLDLLEAWLLVLWRKLVEICPLSFSKTFSPELTLKICYPCILPGCSLSLSLSLYIYIYIYMYIYIYIYIVIWLYNIFGFSSLSFFYFVFIFFSELVISWQELRSSINHQLFYFSKQKCI